MGAAEITPHHAQRQFVEDEHRFVLAVAGAQSGKTIAAARLFGRRVENWTRDRGACNAWVVTPTYELATMPQRYLRERWPRASWTHRMPGGNYAQCVPFRGCLVKFRSAEHPDKLVSEPVDVLWLNETARMKAEAWRGGLRMRINATGGCAIFDTTPMGQNWVYSDLFVPSLAPGHPDHDPAKHDPAFASHTWHTADNPAVSADEIERARRTLPAAYFAREYLADFSAFHGQVYPHFGKACVRRIQESDYPETILGVDWGYAPGHLGVGLVLGVDAKKKRVGVLEEVCAEGKTDDWWEAEFARLMSRYPRMRDAYADPSAPDKIAFFRQRVRHQGRGLAWHEADNSVREGIMLVAEVIGTGSLAVNEGCPNTVRQMTSYHWLDGTERSGGEWQERPAKVDDDCADALRYACMGRFAGRRLWMA